MDCNKVRLGKNASLFNLKIYQQILEFLLQTSYTLVKEAKEEDTDLVFPEIEYRALRHSIRHFEDNLDVMEVQTPIEEIYVHYAIRFLGEDAGLH
ncbi:MAG: hypothetical protein KBB16_03535 [Candidatus Pacebacteria bacterium]|nr:hypothetical protein [Candidatus Paceibacterota bacterium]